MNDDLRLAKRYPAPDRSNFAPNQHRDDPTQPEGDLGAAPARLSDGRPVRVEAWFSEGYTFVTLFFSVLDIEAASPEALCALVAPLLEQERVPVEHRRLGAGDVHKLLDASGNEMYTLTFVVGEPEL